MCLILSFCGYVSAASYTLMHIQNTPSSIQYFLQTNNNNKTINPNCRYNVNLALVKNIFSLLFSFDTQKKTISNLIRFFFYLASSRIIFSSCWNSSNCQTKNWRIDFLYQILRLLEISSKTSFWFYVKIISCIQINISFTFLIACEQIYNFLPQNSKEKMLSENHQSISLSASGSFDFHINFLNECVHRMSAIIELYSFLASVMDLVVE